jgi:hypothetical protein
MILLYSRCFLQMTPRLRLAEQGRHARAHKFSLVNGYAQYRYCRDGSHTDRVGEL